MRTIKLVLVVLIGIALMLVMAANMNPVTIYLIPESFAPGLPALTEIPLAWIIVAAFVGGLVLGMLMELIREGKFRRRLDLKRREVSELRDENVRLAKRLSAHGDDVAAIGS